MKNIYVNMITTSIKLKKQLGPTCNFFLLLEHFKQNKNCKNADNISSSKLLCPHVEEEILLNTASFGLGEAGRRAVGGDGPKDAAYDPLHGRADTLTDGGDRESASTKGSALEEAASKGLQLLCSPSDRTKEPDLNLSYKNRNIYNH